MNDELKKPLRDLILKLEWPNDQNYLADRETAVVEIQSA